MNPEQQRVPLNEPLYGATLPEALRRFFKKYATFSGYASRSEYWWVQLVFFIVSLVPMIGLLSVEDEPYTPLSGFSVISLVFAIILTIAIIVPSLAVTWRRLHDAGFSGALFFLSFIPYLGSFIVLILTILPTKPEARKPQWDDTTSVGY